MCFVLWVRCVSTPPNSRLKSVEKKNSTEKECHPPRIYININIYWHEVSKARHLKIKKKTRLRSSAVAPWISHFLSLSFAIYIQLMMMMMMDDPGVVFIKPSAPLHIKTPFLKYKSQAPPDSLPHTLTAPFFFVSWSLRPLFIYI